MVESMVSDTMVVIYYPLKNFGMFMNIIAYAKESRFGVVLG
jgi:hypothetical protein